MEKTINVKRSGSVLTRIALARVPAALVSGMRTVKAPVVKATVVQTIPRVFRSGNPSKRIALTPFEVSALRLAARTVGLL